MFRKVKEKIEKTEKVKNKDKDGKHISRGERNVKNNDSKLSKSNEIQQKLNSPAFITISQSEHTWLLPFKFEKFSE